MLKAIETFSFWFMAAMLVVVIANAAMSNKEIGSDGYMFGLCLSSMLAFGALFYRAIRESKK